MQADGDSDAALECVLLVSCELLDSSGKSL